MKSIIFKLINSGEIKKVGDLKNLKDRRLTKFERDLIEKVGEFDENMDIKSDKIEVYIEHYKKGNRWVVSDARKGTLTSFYDALDTNKYWEEKWDTDYIK